MSSYILDKAYTIAQDGGVGAYLVVVPTMIAGEAVSPMNSAWLKPPLGVTVHSQSMPGANVAVRKAGVARVIAKAPFLVGEPLFFTLDGKVCNAETYKRLNPDYRWAWCLGFSETDAQDENDVAEVFISIHHFYFL